MNRYIRNMNMLTLEENKSLRNFKVCVVGCGGLGGYIIEFLGRLGIGYITAADGDIVDETNLNRQILSDETVLGKSKVFLAKSRMKKVNSQIKINAIPSFFTKETSSEIIKGHHVIVDALDNLPARLLLQECCKAQNLPLVHGAIAGWYGQVCTIFAGDDTLNKIYSQENEKGIERDLGNPSFTPALVASIQVSEVLKILLGKGPLLRNQLLTLNLLNHEYEIIEL